MLTMALMFKLVRMPSAFTLIRIVSLAVLIVGLYVTIWLLLLLLFNEPLIIVPIIAVVWLLIFPIVLLTVLFVLRVAFVIIWCFLGASCHILLVLITKTPVSLDIHILLHLYQLLVSRKHHSIAVPLYPRGIGPALH